MLNNIIENQQNTGRKLLQQTHIPGDTPVIKSNIRGLTKQKVLLDDEQLAVKEPRRLAARKAAGADGWLSEEARESMNVFLL